MQSPSATDAAALPELSGHDVQVSDVCAVAALYFPLTQSVHTAAEDATALNVPAPQAAMVEPEPVKPASALQSPSATDAAALPELSGQAVHAAAPEAALNMPDAHAEGVPPSGPVKPATAAQAAEPVAPPVSELVGQSVHAAAEPEVALNWPAPQAVQEPIDPVVPAPHPVVKV